MALKPIFQDALFMKMFRMVCAPSLTLVVDMKNKSVAGAQNVELAYLTSGLSWKADYVADLQADNTLTLNGWITLKNDSGVDYNNATVQLIAGSVNQVSSNVIRPLMMARSFKAMGAVAESAAWTALYRRRKLLPITIFTICRPKPA